MAVGFHVGERGGVRRNGTLEVRALSSALATSGYRLVPESVRVAR